MASKVAKVAKAAERDSVYASCTESQTSEDTDGFDSDIGPSHMDGQSGIKLRIDLRSLTAVRVDSTFAEAEQQGTSSAIASTT